jgi:uncharacterized membrane protein
VAGHLVDQSWPMHARFHAIQSLLWVFALNVTIALLAFGPVRRGERWALYTVGLVPVATDPGSG